MEFFEIYAINNGLLHWSNLANIKKKHDLFEYWCRNLYQRFTSRFTFSLPEEWSEEYFKAYLFGKGYISVIPTELYGWIPQDCMLTGHDVFDRPNKVTVYKEEFDIHFEGYYSPYNKNGEIGRDCVLIKCSNDFMGYIDIITFYAHKLTLLTASLDMAIINCRFAYAVASKDKTSGKTIKAIMDAIAEGRPSVVYDANLFKNVNDGEDNWNFLERGNLKQSYITTDVLNDLQTTLHLFDEAIGIANLKDKKERMITNEVETENAKAITVATSIIEMITKSFEILKEVTGIECTVKLNGEGGEENARRESHNSGNVSTE